MSKPLYLPSLSPEKPTREQWLRAYREWFEHYLSMTKPDYIGEDWAHRMVEAAIGYRWRQCYGEIGQKHFSNLRDAFNKERLRDSIPSRLPAGNDSTAQQSLLAGL
ncbi:hypothetical protein BAE30_00300 [Acidithiobacillus caldus]|jgi:hypothetical protein|uniref:Uncharacterized protein n=1 Tax=Acidithiobacillus caldus TaxID=33059 RepID=A0A1E7Z4C3_9PROT|nr:hypothetical protein BAE30_00300 [Acidithiobacillus caldus]